MSYNQHSIKNQPSSVKVEFLVVFPPKHLLKQVVGEDSLNLTFFKFPPHLFVEYTLSNQWRVKDLN
jgi:hypothetical protein